MYLFLGKSERRDIKIARVNSIRIIKYDNLFLFFTLLRFVVMFEFLN